MKKIKCESCAGVWIVESTDLENQKVCPYCTTSIQGKLEFSDYDSLDKVIYGAILKKGKDILQNPRQLSGFMMDIAPSLRKEIRIFSKTVTEDYTSYIQNAFEQEIQDAEIIINKLHFLFVEEEGLSDDWADMLCKGLYGAILYTKGIGITKIIKVEITDFTINANIDETGIDFNTETLEESLSETDNSKNSTNFESNKNRIGRKNSSPIKSNSNDVSHKIKAMLDRAEKCLLRKDIEGALEQYRQVASMRYTPVYSVIADIYFQKKNYKKAWKWYLESEKAGESIGKYYVGYFYQNGLHVKKNTYLAVKYYEQAANKGLPQAIMAMGDYYESDCKKDDKKALEYYLLAAEKGYAEAQYKVGRYYQKGTGCNKDITIAAKWFRKAYLQGHTKSKSKLEECIAGMSFIQKSRFHSLKL